MFELGLIFGILAGSVLAAFLFSLAALRLAGILQQGGYAGGKLLKWSFRKGNMQRKRFSLLALSLVLLTALFCLCFSFLDSVWANLISLLPFVGILALYLVSERKYALKVPAKRTARMIRLAVAHYFVLLVIIAGVGFGMAAAAITLGEKWFALFRFVPIAAAPLVLPLTLSLANMLMKAYEIPHNRAFVRRAGKALAASKCVKVGITGSFGKTSVKHFMQQALSKKYRVVATPASYNTPMGIARTVNEQGLDCDIFLAEMGARHTGDIAELCELVKPDFGLITGVCAQHVETFGSVEQIATEKAVLIGCVKTVVLGKTAPAGKAEKTLREGVDFRAENIVCTADATQFDLYVCGKTVHIRTKLLGKHAQEDVALAAALCCELGLSPEEFASAAESFTPVPHRLEKMEANGLVILDDSYNSNIEGAKNAVEALKLFGGKKVVVTPGLVELGELEEQTNEELGAALVGLDVVLVGETLVLPVRRGYLAAGGDEARLKVVSTLAAAQALLGAELQAGDSVLFLNDLPDIYR